MGALRNILTSPLRAEGTRVRLLLLLVLLGVLGLGYAGALDGAIAFLDSPRLTLEVETVRVTPYRVLKIVLVILLLMMLAGTLTSAAAKSLGRAKNLNASNRELLTKTFQIFTVFLAFLLGLQVLDIDLTAFAVVGGAVGIGIGFGLQKIASNFISGFILLMEKSVEVGDMIELPEGVAGFVRRIGARYILVETFDSKEIMVPNEDFITSKVTNWTFTNTKARIDISIGVAYGSDLEGARDAILEAMREHPRTAEEPAPRCYLQAFADSSVNFLGQFWIEDVREGRFEPRSDVHFAIARKFKERGVEIPFPQRDVHIRSGSVDLGR